MAVRGSPICIYKDVTQENSPHVCHSASPDRDTVPLKPRADHTLIPQATEQAERGCVGQPLNGQPQAGSPAGKRAPMPLAALDGASVHLIALETCAAYTVSVIGSWHLLGPYTDKIRMHKEPMILNLASSQPVALSTSFLTMVQVRRTSTGVHELVNATRDDDSQSERTSFILAVKARMRLCPFCPCPFLDQSFAALCAATTVPA